MLKKFLKVTADGGLRPLTLIVKASARLRTQARSLVLYALQEETFGKFSRILTRFRNAPRLFRVQSDPRVLDRLRGFPGFRVFKKTVRSQPRLCEIPKQMSASPFVVSARRKAQHYFSPKKFEQKLFYREARQRQCGIIPSAVVVERDLGRSRGRQGSKV